MPQRPLSPLLAPWGDRRRGCIGLLGGSFNPAHEGHRHLSLVALAHLKLDAVWWLVSPQNPLKGRADMAPLRERLETARVMAQHPRIRLSAIEARLGSGFTADTLKILQQCYPRIHFVWLMGADNLAQIPRWHHWTSIFARMPIAIMDRAPYSHVALAGLAAHRFARRRVSDRGFLGLARRKPPAWAFLAYRRHAASATAIRARRSGAGIAAPDPTGGLHHP